MKEFRRSRRRQLSETVQVTDSMTDTVVGHIGNFGLPDGPVRLPFEVGAHLLWRDQASAPGQAWTGFRFITMSDEQMEQLRRWIDAPGSQYA